MSNCKYLLLFLLLCFTGLLVAAQTDSVVHRIILAGDAGEMIQGKQPELELIKKLYNLNNGNNSIIYLGDNIYPAGLPPAEAANYEAMRLILQGQVDVVKASTAHAYIIPGNHDWKKGKPGGWDQIKNQFNYIQSLQLSNVHFVPENGCPGPVEIKLAEELVLVVMDSQWWLHQNEKPGVQSDCDCKTTDDVLTSLKDIVYRNRNKLLLFATHHPFKTYGKHGGYFTLKQHIFPLTEANPNLYIPLPVIGSLYPLARGVFGNIQDTHHPVYKKMVSQVDEVLKQHPYCIRVAGHDHNLQLIQDSNKTYIVSGGAAKESQVKKGALTTFAAAKSGFTVLEILKNGNVVVKFFSTQNKVVQEPLFATNLAVFKPTVEKEVVAGSAIFPDSITAVGVSYYKAGGIKKLFFGSNYRKEWGEPIRVPVLNLQKEMGGLKPLQRGGGKQSKSLRLLGADGKEYVLRSIEKFPDKALAEEFRETFVKDMVKDGISASYPYAALSVPAFAIAAGVPHANPKLVYVPDDALLGMYKSDFANTLCILEEREPGVAKTYSTDKVYEKLAEDNDNTIDQHAALKARLLDMFLMDFDRHEDQWRWGATEHEKGKTYYPIPRDRDQVFFTNSGIIPRMASRPWIMPQLQGFRAHAKNIKGFNFAARNFDRSFLNELTEADWKKAAEQLVSEMTDAVIEAGVKQQPKELQQYDAGKIINTLKERRKYLVEEAIVYYKFISKQVSVAGSNKKELFEVTRNDDGSVSVAVYKMNKEGETGKKLFERKLVKGETKEIRLYGMGDDDKFVMQGSGNKTITVRIIGGTGNDVFDNNANAATGVTRVYDLSSEQNQFTGKSSTAQKLSADPAVHQLDRRGFKYNILAPFISVNYNLDDGLYLGLSFKYTSHGFRKNPYNVLHNLTFNHALATSAFNFSYNMEAVDAVGKADLVFKSSIKAPNNTINFFKYGNESVFNKVNKKSIQYYRARFNLADVALMLRGNIGQHATIAAGPSYQFFSMDRNDNLGRFIAYPSLNGLDSSSMYKTKNYVGLQFSTVIDNRDNKIIPTRGIHWQTTARLNKGITGVSKNYTQLNSDLALYMSFNTPATVVVATRLGGGINFGSYEFFQAQYLSGTENMRGFRKYRFAGDKIVYSNTDLRIKIADINTYLFPGAIGLLGFYDVGRVWQKNEISSKWHQGYGGGIWLAPFKKFVVTASYTASDEGGLPLIAFGFQF